MPKMYFDYMQYNCVIRFQDKDCKIKVSLKMIAKACKFVGDATYCN